MPRLRPRAVPAQTTDVTLGQDTQPAAESTYLQKVLAYIPIESVALYQVAVNELGKDDPYFGTAVRWIWYATPFWMLYSTHKKGEGLSWDQAVTSVPAYIFWLAGLQSPFIINFLQSVGVKWKDGYGTFSLIIGSMLLPVLGEIVLRIVFVIQSVYYRTRR